ncbi:uncharacterized membrane protein YsdA (DUF1294 family)/cold shock CspA family protein [Hydrogenophaga palleronii]|uniref:Uncharacterized membrane protein YsdA (DUF1294 family)/cold shock CspA family protein n=1 Tax=Hydrogenophaga palleronii TaxID=65655 RepID=A0ABU1WGZ1_9BURK|nr:cold shock and DUF1294 domain-containing protein [Hydrogenophaga palleronii]MDR7148526.1 uncharacterized membrane protein YsdA (DUF1294 family)/cold shock CspA family protein [Hydrogenophaga palleronii]
MRFSGAIKTWNDDRGFGFIEADQGGQEVFVHIKAFSSRAGRPQLNQRVTFEVELNRDGKKRAKNVEVAKPARLTKARQSHPSAQWGTASMFAILAFGIVYLAVAFVWSVPGWMAMGYIIASIVCFGAYAADKSAAVSGGWRISERNLLLLGLAGGWPGAIVAQQFLRHKSSKASFRSAFWATVVLNIAGFIAINSPFV